MSNIYERAVISAFQPQIEQGLSQPVAQLKSIERRMRNLSERTQEPSPSLESLITSLVSGIVVQIGPEQFVAQLTELEDKAKAGLMKRLARTVDKKTRNPKTSRGTIWRRNSTVKERRRISPEWASGSTARTEARRMSRVSLTPYQLWQTKQEQVKIIERQEAIERIRGKKEKRNYKKLEEQEFQRRLELQQTPEELLATVFVEKLKEMCEKNGIACENELFVRVVDSLKRNQAVPILFIWGPPYEGQSTDENLFDFPTPEAKMSDEIEDTLNSLNDILPIQPILLFADTYGTEINGMDRGDVNQYFSSLQQRFLEQAAVLSWSQVINSNGDRYDQLKRQITGQVIVSQENVENAKIIQNKLGQSINNDTAEQLAILYKTERLTEAQLLTEGFRIGEVEIRNIIKLATAPNRQRNDEPYERDLPRFYVKNMTRAAWNKPRENYVK